MAGNADEPNAIVFTDVHGRVITGSGRGERMDYGYFSGWISDAELARRAAAATERSRRHHAP